MKNQRGTGQMDGGEERRGGGGVRGGGVRVQHCCRFSLLSDSDLIEPLGEHGDRHNKVQRYLKRHLVATRSTAAGGETFN